MKKKVELVLSEPIYSTFHNQGPGSAVLVNNPSIRNFYLNQTMLLACTRKFLHGFTTPEINIIRSSWHSNPHLEKQWYDMRFLGGYIHPVIRNLLDEGYCVCFTGIDDYYVEGKSWYMERHFCHDGAICGYDRENKTYCLYAYDHNWVYRKFWASQNSFDNGRKAMFKQGVYGTICGIKAKEEQVLFSPDTALEKIGEYLHSSMDQYPEEGEGAVYGIVVHDYIAKYIGKLYDGSIPYERMDRRIFRLIWEHKKTMLERIVCIENAFAMAPEISKRYESVVADANTIRTLYASHHMKRRDAVLPIVQKKLLALKGSEQSLLTNLLETSKEYKLI